MMERGIQISVCCTAYNHEKYIRECLDSIVMQQAEVGFEIIVNDDASTDNTASIIREYEEKYPNLIRAYYQTENQYSQYGIKGVLREVFSHARGKYIAFCETDDYWTDPQKIQKQYEAMEAHPEVDICAHAVQVINSSDPQKTYAVAPKWEDTVIPAGEVIAGGGAYVMTSSLFFRRDMQNNIPRFRDFLEIDYTIQMHGSLRGGMLYLKDNMSVYRSLVVEGWTVKFQKNKPARKAYYEDRQRMLQLLDEDTEGMYHEVIEQKMLTNEFQQYLEENQCQRLFDPKFQTIMDGYSLKAKLKLRIKAYFPWLMKIKSKFTKGGFEG